MKIAFLTAGLEPGRDGVADYARLLAEELTRRGHRATLLGLNDRMIPKPKRSETTVDGVNIPVLRLPEALPWPVRVDQARPWLESFGPEWVSLQFVCYGFHPRGLVAGLSRWLAPLRHGRRLQVMLHELWVGPHLRAKPRERLLGLLQRHFVRRLLAQLQPELVHTSNPAYVELLRRCEIAARCLPLFGNVPVTGGNADEWLSAELRNAGFEVTAATRGRFWLFGLFGTLHPVWPAEPLLSRVEAAARRHRRTPVVVSIGRLGSGEASWEQLARQYSGRIGFVRLGERPGELVSQCFHALDFGIATSPLALIGKSGSAIAMLEHDLPVIVNREEVRYRGVDADAVAASEPGIIRLDEAFEQRLGAPRERRPARRLPRVAETMLHDLTGRAALNPAARPSP